MFSLGVVQSLEFGFEEVHDRSKAAHGIPARLRFLQLGSTLIKLRLELTSNVSKGVFSRVLPNALKVTTDHDVRMSRAIPVHGRLRTRQRGSQFHPEVPVKQSASDFFRLWIKHAEQRPDVAPGTAKGKRFCQPVPRTAGVADYDRRAR